MPDLNSNPSSEEFEDAELQVGALSNLKLKTTLRLLIVIIALLLALS